MIVCRYFDCGVTTVSPDETVLMHFSRLLFDKYPRILRQLSYPVLQNDPMYHEPRPYELSRIELLTLTTKSNLLWRHKKMKL